MSRLIVANWKMNPVSAKEAVSLAERIASAARNPKNAEIVICPPSVYLSPLSSVISHKSSVKLGAQDVFWENPPTGKGPYTGEVSPAMLKNLGVRHVIVGHSERRRWLQETDEMINKKVLACLKVGLKVVLCVGEPKRESGRTSDELRSAKNFVKNQLKKNLTGISRSSKFMIRNSLIIAYEPVWAIGTGTPDEPERAVEMMRFIKSQMSHIKCRVLYGGSVNSQNAADFLRYREVDGVLVGGASLNAKEFERLIKKSSGRNQNG